MHDAAENRHAWFDSDFGVPAGPLSEIVGTSVFASLGLQVSMWTQIVVGSIRIAAAVLIHTPVEAA